MQLIGLLDSPYVRRTAVSMRLLGVKYEHKALSVFRNFDEFRAINPVVKAPTVLCDDGTMLMDSNLILDYVEELSPSGRALMPKGLGERVRVLRVLGLAIAACEKSISIVYERQLRPAEKQHEPWVERVTGQLLAACEALEAELGHRPLDTDSHTIHQDGVTTAVTWTFLQMMVPDLVAAASYPRLRDFTARAEKLAEFQACPPV
jgi:glutathione S-transferase